MKCRSEYFSDAVFDSSRAQHSLDLHHVTLGTAWWLHDGQDNANLGPRHDAFAFAGGEELHGGGTFLRLKHD